MSPTHYSTGRTTIPQYARKHSMNWDTIEGNWKQFKGKAKSQWGKLTDDQLDVVAGKRDQLAGRIQEAYGISKEEAEDQIKRFQQAASGKGHQGS